MEIEIKMSKIIHQYSELPETDLGKDFSSVGLDEDIIMKPSDLGLVAPSFLKSRIIQRAEELGASYYILKSMQTTLIDGDQFVIWFSKKKINEQETNAVDGHNAGH